MWNGQCISTTWFRGSSWRSGCFRWMKMSRREFCSSVSEPGDICGCLHPFDSIVLKWSWGIPISVYSSVTQVLPFQGPHLQNHYGEVDRRDSERKGVRGCFSTHPYGDVHVQLQGRWEKCFLDTSQPMRSCFVDSLVPWTPASLFLPHDSHGMRMG